MEQRKVSVIIPIYNAESYLMECLECIIHQTYQNIEIICVDDCSVDQSVAIVHRLMKQDHRIKLISNPFNSGAAASRNNGLTESIGDFILFVDADDRISSTLIQDCMEHADGMDLICFDYKKLDKHGDLIDTHSYKINDGAYQGIDYIREAVKEDSVIFSVWSKMISKAFLTEHQIVFPVDNLYEDVYFSYMCYFHAKQIYSLNKREYEYMQRQNSISTSKVTAKNLESYFDLIGMLTKDCIGSVEEEPVIIAKEDYIRSLIDDFVRCYRKCTIEERKNAYQATESEKKKRLYQIFAERALTTGKIKHLSESQVCKIKEFEHVIVYGGGDIARSTLEVLDIYDIALDGIAVTSDQHNKRSLCGLRIRSLYEYQSIKDSCLVIIATGKEFQQTIEQNLKEQGFLHYLKI